MANQTEIVGVLKLKGGDNFVRDVNRKLDGVRKSFLNLNNVVSATLFTLFAKKMLDAANQSEQASAKIRQAIESTGGAAGVTASELEKMASNLQRLGIYEDDAIKEAQALLLTFTRISRDVFPATVETILDVSAALGQDLKSSAIQVGKALNDPIVGVDALRRVGVQFTDQQQEQIKALVQSGDLLGAQKMILEELRIEFGGMNKAMGETAAGGLTRFRNGLDDLMETGGELVQKILMPFVNILNPIVHWLNESSQSTKNFVGAIVLMIAQMKILAIVLTGLQVAMGPTGWLIAGITALAGGYALLSKNAKEARTEIAGLTIDQAKQKLQELRTEFDSLARSMGSPNVLGGLISRGADRDRFMFLKSEIDRLTTFIHVQETLARRSAGAGGGTPTIPGLPTPEQTEAAFDFNRRAQDQITELFIKGGIDRTTANQEIMNQMIEDARRLAAEEEAIMRERNQRILDQAMFIRDAVANIGISIAESFRTGENKLKAALKQILLTVLDAIDRYVILAKIKSLLDAAINPFAALKSIAPLAIASGLLQVVKGQIAAMAEGGLVTRPTLALVGEAGPEVVAPQADFVEFANQLLGQRNGSRRGEPLQIVQHFNTPLNDRRQARFLTDTVLKPTIRREQNRRGRRLNQKVI